MKKRNIVRVGSMVEYWRGDRSGPPSGTGRVYELGTVGGTKVVWIQGCTGCVARTHVRRLP